jgi:ABC-type sugar transport system permease subunit
LSVTIRERQRLRPSALARLMPAAALLIGPFLVPIGYPIYLGFTNLELLRPTAQNYSFTGPSTRGR